MMFHPERYKVEDAEIREAAARRRLLSLEIEFGRACNYACPYCYAADGSGKELPPEMSSELIDATLRQAAELGARRIVILGGEPLLYPHLEEKVALINSLGMGAEIFTNGALLTSETAAMLARYDVKMAVKLNSLDAAVQQRMTGEPGALDKALRALELLEQAGFDEPGRLAASSVIASANVAGIAGLWRYLRGRGIEPYFEIMTPQGRLLENGSLEVDPARLEQVFFEIARIDREEYGRQWEPQPPLVGERCFRHLYSALVNASGEVMPCVGVTTVLGSVAERPLAEILGESSVMRDFREYALRIKSPCRECDKHLDCYGCRGAAYQLTGDYLAADPTCWRNRETRHAIKFLPHPAAGLLPHGEPMAMIDEIVSTGQRSILRAVIRPDNRFLDESGRLDRAALVEIAAQACAAASAFRDDGKVRPGMLAAVKQAEFFRDVHAGDELFIEVEETAKFDVWYLTDFRIFCDGETVAEGELKLCVFF